jgi:large subunit ribosomal protein L29
MAIDVAKLREKSVDELDKEEQNLRGEIWKLRIQRTTGQLQDHHRVRQLRRDLARVLTVKRERQSAARS